MTGYTIPIEKDMACANAAEKISTAAAQVVSKKINGMELKEAKVFLGKLVAEKVSINNKFHTNTATCILELVKSAENNAITKGLDTESLKLVAAAHKGPKMYRGRRKRAFGMRMKSTHLQIVLKPFQKSAKTKEKVAMTKEKTETKNAEAKKAEAKK